jgi:hypothetical protein
MTSSERFREKRMTRRSIQVMKLIFRALTVVLVMTATSAAFIGQGALLIQQNSTHSGDAPLDVYASVLAKSSNDNTSSSSDNNGNTSSTSSKQTSKKTPTPKPTATSTPRPVASPPSGPVGGPCWFVFGFKTLHDLIPAIMGDCKEIEHFELSTGNSLQATVGGLAVWRKEDNWTAFTNGTTTWLLGPCGLQTRPNAGPFFSWEGKIGAPCST